MSTIRSSSRVNTSKSDGRTPSERQRTLRSSSFLNTASKSTPFAFRKAKTRTLSAFRDENKPEDEVELATTENKAIEDVIFIETVIVNRSFRMYHVSPLFGLRYERRFLNAIARKLSFFMQKENKFGYDYMTFKGTSMLKVDIKLVCDADENIVGICLNVINTGEYDDETREIFFGIMTSGGSMQVGNVLPGFVWLPLLLVKGSIEITDRITNFFTREFDCLVSAFELPSVELCWLSAMWAGFNADIPRKPLTLKYATPKNVTGLETITLSVNSKHVYDLWSSVHDTKSSEFVIEEVNVFFQSLEKHFFSYFAFDLQGLLLIEIRNTSILVNSNGRLKLFAHETAAHIVSHLASLATKQVPF